MAEKKKEPQIIENEDQLAEPDADDSSAGGGSTANPVREGELEDADELEDDDE